MRSLIRIQHAESARAGQIQHPDVLQVSVVCTGRGPRRASFDPRRSAAAWQDALAASQPYFRWLAVALGVWLGLRAHPIATRAPTPPACATINSQPLPARRGTPRECPTGMRSCHAMPAGSFLTATVATPAGRPAPIHHHPPKSHKSTIVVPIAARQFPNCQKGACGAWKTRPRGMEGFAASWFV